LLPATEPQEHSFMAFGNKERKRKMEGIKLNTLENIEKVMPKIQTMLANDSKSLAIGPKVVAPLAEAIITIAKELRQLRDSKK